MNLDGKALVLMTNLTAITSPASHKPVVYLQPSPLQIYVNIVAGVNASQWGLTCVLLPLVHRVSCRCRAGYLQLTFVFISIQTDLQRMTYRAIHVHVSPQQTSDPVAPQVGDDLAEKRYINFILRCIALAAIFDL